MKLGPDGGIRGGEITREEFDSIPDDLDKIVALAMQKKGLLKITESAKQAVKA